MRPHSTFTSNGFRCSLSLVEHASDCWVAWLRFERAGEADDDATLACVPGSFASEDEAVDAAREFARVATCAGAVRLLDVTRPGRARAA
jgi:hypothetical protein